jgi:hypothetical protein
VVLAPNPILNGQTLHLRFPSLPTESITDIYTLDGEAVFHQEIDGQESPNWRPSHVAPGLYVVVIRYRTQNGGPLWIVRKKVAVLH